MPFDKWGIPFFYPSKKTAGITGAGTGFFWEQDNNIFNDSKDGMVRLGKEYDQVKVINSSTGEWEFPYLTDGDGLDMSGPTGHHSGGETHGCQGFTYMSDTNLMGGTPSFRFRKETYHVNYKDHPSGEYTSSFATGPCINHWKGYGWVRYNKKDGRSPGKDSVICEAWWNDHPDVDIKDWHMLKRVEDKGAGVTNWGIAATCDGDAYQVGTWSNIQFRFKSSSSDFSLHPIIPEFEDGSNINSIGGENMSFADSENRGYGKRADMPRDIEMKCLVKWDAGGRGKAHFKNISLREIDPTLSFDDTPTTPPEPPTGGGGTGGGAAGTTLQGSFKFQWDINTVRTQSQCAGTGVGGGGVVEGGGAEPGNTKFYSIYTDDGVDSDKELSNTSTWDNRTRIMMSAKNSSSILNGKKPIQVDIPLKKVGSPTSSKLVYVSIYSSGGSLIYTSPNTVNPTTLTTSYVLKKFDFSSNTHTLVVGDRIGVVYGGTDASNYVVASYGGTAFTNTAYYQYEGTNWQEKTRKLTMDIWE